MRRAIGEQKVEGTTGLVKAEMREAEYNVRVTTTFGELLDARRGAEGILEEVSEQVREDLLREVIYPEAVAFHRSLGCQNELSSFEDFRTFFYQQIFQVYNGD